MGCDLIDEMGIPDWISEVIHVPSGATNAEDTKAFVTKAVGIGAELIIFCGGDGTARDVFSQAGSVPIFGIPAGVKMHSGVFAIDPLTAGEILEFFIRGEMKIGDGEIMDLDEERYRSGEWNIALFGIARTLYEPSFIQAGKLMVEEESIEDVLSGMAEDIGERLGGGEVLILGPGGTTSALSEILGFGKTLLGVDVVTGKVMIGRDCTEKDLLSILSDRSDRKVRIVLSPIGGQGFFLGRGNLQLSPEVIRKVGIDNILVISTPHKLEATKVLHVDTGDPSLDAEIRSRKVLKVLVGYRSYRLVKIE
jgi:predicted polyphosphate/ATP-dependent NAD kinase